MKKLIIVFLIIIVGWWFFTKYLPAWENSLPTPAWQICPAGGFFSDTSCPITAKYKTNGKCIDFIDTDGNERHWCNRDFLIKRIK